MPHSKLLNQFRLKPLRIFVRPIKCIVLPMSAKSYYISIVWTTILIIIIKLP